MKPKDCHNCQHHNDCQDVYEQLGNSKSPPITIGVLQAFLLPLVIFIVTAVASQRAFDMREVHESVRILLCVLAGIAAVGIYVVIIKTLWRAKNRD